MSRSSRQFPDEFDDLLSQADLSDADLEALLAGKTNGAAEGLALEAIEPGTRLRGTVVDRRGGEVLVELDQKTHGVVDEADFAGELPRVGQTLEATFQRYDSHRDLAVLSVSTARREVLWEELRPGMELTGTAVEANKGGLTIDIRGIRAFMPLSQIDRERVDDPSPHVGKKLRFQVLSVDRAAGDVVVSRRAILEREAEELKGKALARLAEGETLKGRVVRVGEHGAFVDLGGIEGLLHATRIRQRQRELGEEGALSPGQEIEVEITRVDRERGRVALDLKRLAASSWGQAVEGYAEGDTVTGWVTRLTPDGAIVVVEEGVEGMIPRRDLLELARPIRRGDVLRARVTRIDREAKVLELRTVEEGG